MKLFPIPQVLTFLACLVLGRFFGIQYAEGHTVASAHQALRQSDHPALSQLPADQVNFLVVKVDALESEQPRLESLWWLLHKPQGALNLVSIFPSLKYDAEADARLASAFALNEEAGGIRLAQSFELALQSLGVNWDGFLILDETAFRLILGKEAFQFAGAAAPLPFPTPASRLVQWQEFCRVNLQTAWHLSPHNSWAARLDGEHLSFGPVSSLSQAVWGQLMTDTPTRVCSFPGLESGLTH